MGTVGTHKSGIGHDMRDVLRSANRVSAICSLFRDICKSGYDEWETLAVDNMPVKRIDLHSRCQFPLITFKNVRDIHGTFNVRYREATCTS
jgi:hypothetical protein